MLPKQLFLAILLTVGSLACRESTSPSTVLLTDYRLSTVNGQAPPSAVTGQGEVIAIRDAYLNFSGTNTVVDQRVVTLSRTGVSQPGTVSRVGTYTQDGGTLTIVYPATDTTPAVTLNASVSGKLVTVTDRGLVLVYTP